MLLIALNQSLNEPLTQRTSSATSQALLLFSVAEASAAIGSWYLNTQEQTHEHLLRTS
jgi:hypothetical protein